MGTVEAELVQLTREHAPRVLALLASRFGDVDVADDAVQDALAAAAETWPDAGVPANPAAWLHQVAGRKGVDRLRRATSARRRTLEAAPHLVSLHADSNDTINPNRTMIIDDPILDPELTDNQLRLMFLCCHPALGTDSQVALTLRLVGGLTTDEIAAAYLTTPSTLGQRISRAKAKIRDARIALRMPEHLDDRLDVVLSVLYLVFNEGYLGRAGAAAPTRVDLCVEAVRLTRSLSELLPGNAEVHGLLALQLFHHARYDARFDTDLDLVLLPDQDRTLWDHATIADANQQLKHAMALHAPGRYQLQALIAGYHTNAATADATNWTMILRLYDELLDVDPSPVVALNRVVALGMVSGPAAGLATLDAIADLENYHLYHATRAEMLVLNNQHHGAIDAFHKASTLTNNPAELRHLNRRIQVASTAGVS